MVKTPLLLLRGVDLHRARHIRGPVLILGLLFVFLGSFIASVLGSELQDLVTRYEKQKAENRTALLPRVRGKRGSRAEARPLQPFLEKILEAGGRKGFLYLQKEYMDPDSEVATAAGLVLLRSGGEEGVRTVIKGFDRRGTWRISAQIRILDTLSKTPDGREFIAKLARSGSVAHRTIAIGSLVQLSRDREAFDVIVEGLAHASPEVRGAAIRAMTKFRYKEMIFPLIEYIGREKTESQQVQGLQLLVKLTGINLGLEVGAGGRGLEEVVELLRGAVRVFHEGHQPHQHEGSRSEVLRHRDLVQADRVSTGCLQQHASRHE